MEKPQDWVGIQNERKNIRKSLVIEHGSVDNARDQRAEGSILTSEEKARAIGEGKISEVLEQIEVGGGDELQRLDEINNLVTPEGTEKRQPSAETFKAYRGLRAEAKEDEEEKGVEQAKKKSLFVELDTIETFLARLRKAEYELTKNPPANLATKLREGANLESIARQRLESISDDPTLALYQREYALVRATQELRDTNFMVTPSRRGYLDQIETLIEQGKPILLEGHTGTGKSELARIAAHELTAHDPEVISCNPQTRISDMYGKQGLKSEGGVSVTATDFGPLTRAIQDGKIVIFDEYNELDPRQRQVLKYLFNAKPGDTVDIPGDGKVVMKEGFGMIMTANLKSDKYQEKGDLEAQEARVFQDSSLRIEYTPREELYDLALVSLMDTEGKIMLTESEAVETLRQFVDAVADIQEAFSKTMPSHYGTDSALDPKSRKRPGLEKYVLDPGMTRRLLTGFQKERMKQGMALRTFINQSLRRTLEGERVSAQDRKLALMIFARYGFLEGKQTGEELGLDYTDGRFSMAMPSIQERALEQGEAFTTLSQAEVAQLDPYELRKRWSDAEIFEEFGVDVTRETATSERTAEAGEMSLAEAEIIMGSERFFGPADVEVTFGSLPEDVPPLRVTREELEQAKAEGQRLVLYTSRLTGSDLTVASIEALLDNQTSQGEKFLYDSEWYIKDSVLKNETPRTEWRLVADECLPGTSGKNYLEQTEIIAQYVRGHGLPVAYQEVIEEFDQNRENIRDILEGNTQKVPAVVVDLQEAGEKLAKLQVNQLFRERFSEVLYRLALVEKKTGVRLLDNAGTSTYYTWTNSRNADGSLVDVGSLDAFGASVGGRKPVNQSDNLGVAFSRRVS